ncbi:MAG: hypothetical protein K9M45_09605 [Kiritimatiellales bacterium]|nr:hypothetical protein [Kiritimatiellales bacterium]
MAYIGPGGPEFMMVMLALLVMFGAKDAPRILRKLNEIMNQIRNTADSFKREVMYGDLNQSKPSYEPTITSDDEDDEDGYDYDEDDYYHEDDYYSDDDDQDDDAEPDAESDQNEEEPVQHAVEDEDAPGAEKETNDTAALPEDETRNA